MFTITTVRGSKATSLHTLSLELHQTEKMSLSLIPGEYWQAGTLVVAVMEQAEIPIPIEPNDSLYDIWLVNDPVDGVGIDVIQQIDGLNSSGTDNYVDRIAWLSVPANCSDLANAEVSVIRMVDTNEN